jgi:hypothetical protein
MHRVSHQTVRLAKGRHSSPQHGVCVMELASMLAGEAFSDRPSSVAPSIAAFLRAYNDMIDDERRQDLYAYAARILGLELIDADWTGPAGPADTQALVLPEGGDRFRS